MRFLAQLAHVWSVLAGRVPLARPHTCSLCGHVASSLSRAQFRDWARNHQLVKHPRIWHSCGGLLQPAGVRPSTVEELTGEVA